MDDRIEHRAVQYSERVDEPLIAAEVAAGLAVSPQMDGQVFVGLSFVGLEEERADIVLTVELAEALLEIVERAVAKARGRVQAGGGDSNTPDQGG